MDNLFSTHPAVENRIAALEDLARQMGRGAHRAQPRVGGSVPASGPAGESPRGPWGRKGPWG
jgi:heat shock protein HtpX